MRRPELLTWSCVYTLVDSQRLCSQWVTLVVVASTNLLACFVAIENRKMTSVGKLKSHMSSVKPRRLGSCAMALEAQASSLSVRGGTCVLAGPMNYRSPDHLV